MKRWILTLILAALTVVQLPAATTFEGTTEDELEAALKQMVQEVDDATLPQLLAAMLLFGAQNADVEDTIAMFSGKDAAGVIALAKEQNEAGFNAMVEKLQTLPPAALRAQILSDEDTADEAIEFEEDNETEEVVITGNTPEEIAASIMLATQLLDDVDLIAFSAAMDVLSSGKSQEEVFQLIVGEVPSALMEQANEVDAAAIEQAVDNATPEQVAAMRQQFLPAEPVRMNVESEAIGRASFMAMVRQLDDESLLDLMTAMVVFSQSGITEAELDGFTAADLVEKAKAEPAFAQFRSLIGQQPAETFRAQLLNN